MSLPSFERPSDITKQTEAWPFRKFHESDDEDCHGLYNQTCPVPFLERLLTRLDHEYDQRQAAKRVLTFDELLTPMPTSQTQRDAQRAHGDYDRTGGMVWDDGLTWWQRLPFITIQERAQTDHVLAEEIARGDWN